MIAEPLFSSRVRRHIDRWQVIVLVDQSGSMLPTHLAVFDTNVVDLTQACSDPLETLMKVQLGGGLT